jgi:hypothetical protein
MEKKLNGFLFWLNEEPTCSYLKPKFKWRHPLVYTRDMFSWWNVNRVIARLDKEEGQAPYAPSLDDLKTKADAIARIKIGKYLDDVKVKLGA